MLKLVEILIKHFLLPELALFIKEREEAGLPFPTADEIEARLHARLDVGIADGEEFLRRKGAMNG